MRRTLHALAALLFVAAALPTAASGADRLVTGFQDPLDTAFHEPDPKGLIDMGIPVEHARWIGSLLAQLSDEQLRAAFHAAAYDEATTEGYVRSLRERINQLTSLQRLAGLDGDEAGQAIDEAVTQET